MAQPLRILFAAGGTGGHVYPAIAIADAIHRRVPDADVRFVGTRERMEWKAVPQAGYPIHPIVAGRLHRGRMLRNLLLPFELARSWQQSRGLVERIDPDVAVGTGGYVSAPVLLSAKWAGKPIVVQEQNAYAGLTNRILGKWSTHVYVAFREAERYFPPGRCICHGNPVRKDLLSVDPVAARGRYSLPADAFVCVVLGGSLGSRAINEAVIARLDMLLDDANTYVLWQSGRRYFEEMRTRVAEHPRLRLFEYVDRMDLVHAVADLVVCRSGAITCSELMVTGTPSILIPSPNVTADHQTHNARSLVGMGAAVMIPESDLPFGASASSDTPFSAGSDPLVDEITRFRSDPGRLMAMSQAAKRMARPDAADRIACDVLRLAGWDFDEGEPSFQETN